MADGKFRPDLMLADFNLPNDMNGLQLTAKLRELLHYELPVIILTGDISILALNEIAIGHCVQLNKPVKLQELTEAIQGLLTRTPSRAAAPTGRVGPTIFVVDDDDQLRETIVTVLSQASWKVEAYASCEAFLEAYRPGGEACLLIDAYLPGMKGLELLQRLRLANDKMPAVMITGSTDIQTAVLAMKAGASDFIEKPIGADLLLATVARAMELSRDSGKRAAWRDAAAAQVSGLTLRQREVMQMVLAGQPSKNIAADLGISQRTVENHRAAIMKKTGSKSVPALTRLALAAEPGSVPDRG